LKRTVSCSNEASAVLILRDIPRRKVLKTYSEVSESRKANCITSRPFAVNIPSSSIRSLLLNGPYAVYAKNKACRQQQQGNIQLLHKLAKGNVLGLASPLVKSDTMIILFPFLSLT
jgi:hypothetical protein